MTRGIAHMAAAVPGPVTGDAAQQSAASELRKQIYHRHDPGPVQRVINWFWHQLNHVTSQLGTGPAGLLLVAFIGAVVAFALLRAGRLPSRRRRSAVDSDLDPRTGVDHRALAASLAAAGDHANAIREWLRAAVGTLEERGVLDPRPGRTGAEIARQASAQLPDAADALTAAVRAVDEIWFAERPATPDDSELGRLAAEAVRSARRRPTTLAADQYAVPM